MNIISNGCLGGYFYRDILKQEYSSPFIWCVVRPRSMLNLIKYYDEINFNNAELQKDDFYHNNKTLDCFKIIVDNKVVIHYTHHHFSSKYTVPTKINCDVFYNKMWELVNRNYTKRIARMTEKPVFLLLDGKDFYNLEEDIRLLEEVKNNNRTCIFITQHAELMSYSSEKILILYDKHTCMDAQHGPSYYAKTFSSKILNFIADVNQH